MNTTISERGQIVIPKQFRDRFGLGPGQRVEFKEEKGRLILMKIEPHDPIDAVFGMIRSSKTSDQIIDELRGSPKEKKR